MAISPVVQDAVQVRMLWAVGAELCINVLNFRAAPSVVINQAFANTVGTAFKASFVAQWAPKCSASCQLIAVGVRDLRVPNGLEYKDQSNPSTGTDLGQSLPSANAVCVTLRTAKSGKSFRGRVYLPGASETFNLTGGVQDAALNTAAVAFINDLNTRMAPNNLTLGVLSRPAEDVKIVKTTSHSDGTTTVKTLSHAVAKTGGLENVTFTESRNTRWETQRRRENGRSTTALAQLQAEQARAVAAAAAAG